MGARPVPHYDAVIIGAGHNGLACACYLARAGLRVIVLEAAPFVGGSVHTATTVPGKPDYRFDTCSVVHNMINMTTVLDELRLAAVGLEYIETDPFTVSFYPDGSAVRFYRSVERTCAEIARVSPEDAEAYAAFIRMADPVVELALTAFRTSGDGSAQREWGKRLWEAGRVARQSQMRHLPRRVVGTYGALLAEWFGTEYAAAGIAALAAHGTLGPHTPGAAFFVLWQAAYHRHGNWHAKGGSGALADALRRRLEAWGGAVRTGARVTGIVVAGTRAVGVSLADGERVSGRCVVAAINPQTTLLELLDPSHLPVGLAARVRSRHRSNAVQFIAHATLDALPPWPGAPADVYAGMQSVAASVAQVEANFHEAEAGYAPSHPAAYLFTPSAIDDTVAPAGKHGAYIACPSYPARFADGSTWEARGEGEAHRLLAAIEERAPGFTDRVTGLAWRSAADWERETGLLGGHPMHLDMTMDQLGPFRPLPELASRRGPVAGLYLSGAGTAPNGGVSAVPGRAAARRVLADWKRLRHGA